MNKDILLDARLYVAYWAQKHNGLTMKQAASVKLDYDADVRTWNWAHRDQIILKTVVKINPLKYASIDLAIEEVIPAQATAKRRSFGELYTCTSENLEPLAAFVYGITGEYDVNTLYVLANWIWAIKRNSMDLSVIHHVVPIIIGKQGAGKSVAVRKLIEPYKDVSLSLKVPQAVDERSYPLFERNLVGFFDEMAGVDRVDIAVFKGNVTDDTLSYRPMRTNEQVVLANRCSFIGTSNHEIYELVKDTTGLRRFWPIVAQEKIDREIINNIDYVALVRGIDENLERGYFEKVQDSVVKVQSSKAMKDEVALFLETYSAIGSGDTVEVDGNILFQEYRQYCMNIGHKFSVSAQTFYKKLQNIFPHEYRRNDKRIWRWYFKISRDNAFESFRSIQ